MTEKAKIGTGQLFALLFTCRLLTTVIYSPFLDNGYFSGSWLLNTVFFAAFIILFSVPAIILYKKYPNDNPITLIDNPVIKNVVSVILFCVFVFYLAFTISRFDMFTTSVVFPEKDMTAFIVAGVLMCAYAAFLGIEAISRANVICFQLSSSVLQLFFFRRQRSLII